MSKTKRSKSSFAAYFGGKQDKEAPRLCVNAYGASDALICPVKIVCQAFSHVITDTTAEPARAQEISSPIPRTPR